MTRHDDSVRLRHMLDSARKAVEFCADRTRADLGSNEMLALALVRLLEILGEAAKAVSAETQAAAPAVPWREVAGTRDRLIHGYADVNLDIVWTTITDDLPQLIAELEKLVPAETG